MAFFIHVVGHAVALLRLIQHLTEAAPHINYGTPYTCLKPRDQLSKAVVTVVAAVAVIIQPDRYSYIVATVPSQSVSELVHGLLERCWEMNKGYK